MASMLVEDTAVLVRGDVRVDESGPPKVSVSDIVPLDVARVALPKQVSITIRLGNGNGSDTAEQLQKLFLGKPGNTDVRLRLIRSQDFLLFYDLAAHVQADRDFRRAVEEICGAGSIEVVPS
jgi:DNA polymerase-3 subunit alpha